MTHPVPDNDQHHVKGQTQKMSEARDPNQAVEADPLGPDERARSNFVRDMVQRCEQLTTSASSMLKDIKATATRYRQEGKRIFDEIESCSGAADEVRKLCEAFRDKIATKTAEGAS